MAQDFAKQRVPTGVRRQPTGRAATKTVPASQTSHWSWYFSGLMSGVIVAIVAYLGLVKLDQEAIDTPQIVQATEDPVEQPTFDFGFYKNLENAEVTVTAPVIETAPVVTVSQTPPSATEETPPAATPETAAITATSSAPVAAAATVTPAPAPAASGEKQSSYLLQVGSFQNRQDAESHRARLIMLNLDASIVAAVVSGRTVQRVLVGPFNSRASAEESREMLSENGIDSIPLLVR